MREEKGENCWRSKRDRKERWVSGGDGDARGRAGGRAQRHTKRTTKNKKGARQSKDGKREKKQRNTNAVAKLQTEKKQGRPADRAPAERTHARTRRRTAKQHKAFIYLPHTPRPRRIAPFTHHITSQHNHTTTPNHTTRERDKIKRCCYSTYLVLGVLPALEDKAAAAAVRESADRGADEVGDGLEETLVLPRVPKNGEEVLL